MKHSFTIVELLVVIAIVSILSICTISFVGDKKEKMQEEIVSIYNERNIIEVYQDDVLIFKGEAKDYVITQEIERVDGNKIFLKPID